MPVVALAIVVFMLPQLFLVSNARYCASPHSRMGIIIKYKIWALYTNEMMTAIVARAERLEIRMFIGLFIRPRIKAARSTATGSCCIMDTIWIVVWWKIDTDRKYNRYTIINICGALLSSFCSESLLNKGLMKGNIMAGNNMLSRSVLRIIVGL